MRRSRAEGSPALPGPKARGKRWVAYSLGITSEWRRHDDATDRIVTAL
jgi:hypothetical protein